MSLLWLSFSWANSTGARAEPTAWIVSGGNPAGNLCSIQPRLDLVGDVLNSANPKWKQTRFINDGLANNASEIPTGRMCDPKGETLYDEGHRPILGRLSFKYPPDGAADLETLKAKMRELVTPPNHPDPFFMYIHNHGSKDPPRISLWGDHWITVDEFRELLSEIPETKKVIVVTETCFGGGMLDGIMRKKDGALRRNFCGFSAASADESLSDDETFMDAAKIYYMPNHPAKRAALPGGAPTFGDIHRFMKRHLSRIATPVSSGDLFLASYIASNKEVIKSERDSLLAHCIFEPSGPQEMASPLAEPMRSAVLANVRLQLERLRAELRDYYKEAEVSPNASYNQVRQKSWDLAAKMEEAELKSNFAYEKLIPAHFAWLKTRMGERNLNCWELLRAEVSDGKRPASSNACTGLPSDPAKRKAEFMRLNALAARESYAMFGNNPDPKFPEFLTQHGVAQALSDYRAAEAEHDRLSIAMQPLRRLEGTIKSANALQRMIDTKDMKALEQYMNILQCEETPMGGLRL